MLESSRGLMTQLTNPAFVGINVSGVFFVVGDNEMIEDNNNQNDLENEDQESSDNTEPEYREISDEELKQILDDHKKWLESDRMDGKCADLKRADLQKAYLFKVNLKEAILNNANLHKALLAGAKLQNAYIQESNLHQSSLRGAELQGASVPDSNLKEAHLVGCNLQKADLSGTTLQRANLSQANLHETNLQGANLYKSNLKEAVVHSADLSKSNLQETALDEIKGLSTAKLQYANFIGATGLLGNEFAQADVTGTKLPDDIKEFKALEIVKETSQNARKIFFAMLIGCVYSWLTIGTTTDVNLLTNTASSPLPIIGTEIPIAWFYLVAPLVLICIYFYFHLYLIKLWEALSGLPAIFPDGKRLDEIAYPWLLNGLVRRHFKLLKKNRPFIAHVQELITIFLAWWVVPITMMVFWLRFIPRHDWVGTIIHCILIVTSVTFAIYFNRLCAITLKREKIDTFTLRGSYYDKRLLFMNP